MSSRLSKHFPTHIPFKIIFQSATLRDLAKAIDELSSQAPSTSPLPEQISLGQNGVSPMELEWLKKHNLGCSTSAFNVTVAFELNSTVNLGQLEHSWNTVLSRHQILRSRYVENSSGETYRDVSGPSPKVQRVPRINIWREANRQFNLAKEAPTRVLISPAHMFVAIHHIICDLTTLQTLLNEVSCVYNGKSLPPLTRTFADTCWSTPASKSDLDFWTEYMQDLPLVPFSDDGIPTERTSYNGTTSAIIIPPAVFTKLLDFSTAHSLTLHQLALSAVALALSTEDDKTDIVLGGPYFNRSAEDIDTVGLFLEPLPIRVQYDPASPLTVTQSFVESVQASSQSALAHAVPWTQLLSHLDVAPAFPNHPLTDVMVTVHDDRKGGKLALPGVEPLLTWTEGAKFKLMCEFFAVSNSKLVLRTEYDSGLLSPGRVAEVQGLIVVALECIAAGMGYREIKEHLRKDGAERRMEGERAVELYGKRLSDL